MKLFNSKIVAQQMFLLSPNIKHDLFKKIIIYNLIAVQTRIKKDLFYSVLYVTYTLDFDDIKVN